MTTDSMEYVKDEYIGAVTLLRFSSDGSLLYVGVGSTLYLYNVESGDLITTHQIFARGILHGMDWASLSSSSNAVAFFGQKRIACFSNVPITPSDATEQSTMNHVGSTRICKDWIFDVQILSEQSYLSYPLVAIGLAHNIVQCWDPNNDTILRTVVCSERCILYSLSFYGRSMVELLVASGTVFQQILLWSLKDEEADWVDPIQRLHGHDGVIFKLAWSSDAKQLVSVSDDRTVQLWSTGSDKNEGNLPLAIPFTSVFRSWGHTARLWDVCFTSHGILTSSEDGMSKLWDAATGLCLATMQGHIGKHVWRVAIHPSHTIMATGGGDSAVKLWDIVQQKESTSMMDRSTKTILPLPTEDEPVETNLLIQDDEKTISKKKKKKVLTMSIRDIVVMSNRRSIVVTEHGHVFQLELPTSGTDTSVTLCCKVNSTLTTINNHPASISCVAMAETGPYLCLGDSQGHVTIVTLSSGGGVTSLTWKAHSSRILKIWWLSQSIWTTSADGVLQEWLISSISELPTLYAMYHGPCATSSLMVLDQLIVTGDCRGNVFAFPRARTLLSFPQSPLSVCKHVHGQELVASLVIRGPLVHSGGHDGYLCTYTVHDDSLCWVGKETIKGITTIKQLWWQEDQLMVLGFQASWAVLYNYTAQCRLFMIDCGGWRRPHAVLTTYTDLSAVCRYTFIYTPPTTKGTGSPLAIYINSCGATSNVPFQKLSLHRRFRGSMTTCVVALGSHLVTAGDDNSIKLHSLQRRNQGQVAIGYSWECVSTGIGHTTTIRALTTRYLPTIRSHIVLSGGGKQRLNVWRVKDSEDVLAYVCGHEPVDADQDHRILGISVFGIPVLSDPERYQLVIACNSEGAIQLFLLDLGAQPETLVLVGTCTSSKKPILSCDGLFVGSSGEPVLAVGSTDGLVNVWNFRPVLDALVLQAKVPSVDEMIMKMHPVHTYTAHDMGTNCLRLVERKVEDKKTLLIISAGDDQSINVLELERSTDTDGTFSVVQENRTVNASGSAIKAVTVSSDANIVYCAGYDQRISRWSFDDTTSTKLQWKGGAFSECADIADIVIAPTNENTQESVVVVGQGLQTVHFNRLN